MGQGAGVQVVSTELERHFPNLRTDGFSITSPRDATYNCIAWAAHDTERWWWPTSPYFWPESVPREESIDAFIRAYATIGFVPCENAVPEAGYEKVAIYADTGGVPTHAARQLPDGRWTSKLGGSEDIEHGTIRALEDSDYGRVAVTLARQL